MKKSVGSSYRGARKNFQRIIRNYKDRILQQEMPVFSNLEAFLNSERFLLSEAVCFYDLLYLFAKHQT